MSSRPSIEQILVIIRDAGTLVKSMQKSVSLSVKQDGSVVTDADINSHTLICQTLEKLTPEIAIISEEQAPEKNEMILKNAPSCWVVDPLDVTANYAGGGNAYSINIAWMENGIPTLGALYFPALDELYYTSDDGKAYVQIGTAAPVAIYVASLSDNHTAAVRPNDKLTHQPASWQALDIIFTRGQRRACLVATGQATFCSEREGFRIWDSAATYAIITAAGGTMQKETGEALSYNEALELPAYFVGHPALLEQLHLVQDEVPMSTNNTSVKRNSA